MTIELSKRRLLLGLAAVALIAAACTAAFLAGQTTRISEADATGRAHTAVERAEDRAQEESDQRAAAIRRYEAHRLDQRVHRLNTMWRKRVRHAADKAREDGFSNGSAAGYSSGSADGYADGNADGYDEGHDDGLEDGSDELTCSDDMDVPLPACDW